MQGRGPWMASCMYVCVCVSVCDFIGACVCLCVCVWEEKGLDYFQKFHSLPFHYSYKATTRLHRVQSCKNFFFCLLFPSPAVLPPPPPPPSFLRLSFFSAGYSWKGEKNICWTECPCIWEFCSKAELSFYFSFCNNWYMCIGMYFTGCLEPKYTFSIPALISNPVVRR